MISSMQNWTQLFILLVLLIAQLVNCEDAELVWKSFKSTFAKRYSNSTHEKLRKQTFLKNVKTITQFNTNSTNTFEMGVNKFTDLSYEEFLSKYTGLSVSLSAMKTVVSDPPGGYAKQAAKVSASYPTSLNYQNTGYVSTVKDQSSCGCCWAFAASGAVEAQTYRLKGSMISVSEQQMVDCSSTGNNNGCNGGNQVYAFMYMSKGMMTESAYPYKASKGSCKAVSSKYVTGTYVPVSYYYLIGTYTDSTLTVKNYKSFYSIIDPGTGDSDSTFASSVIKALNEVGPLAIEFCAYSDFQNYKSGIYYNSASCPDSSINHAVLLVGYDISSSTASQKYWIIKNQWNTNWGISGYAYVRYAIIITYLT